LPGTGIPSDPPKHGKQAERVGPLVATVGDRFSGLVAELDVTQLSNLVGSLTVSIHWGDGRSSKGSIARSGDDYLISGHHVYTSFGSHTITVTIRDAHGDVFTVDHPAKVVDELDLGATDTVFSTAP